MEVVIKIDVIFAFLDPYYHMGTNSGSHIFERSLMPVDFGITSLRLYSVSVKFIC